MRRTNLALALLVPSVICGCRTDVRLSEGRHFPKKPGFTVQPQTNSAEAGLDFNAVYYSRHEPPTNSDLRVSYNYCRFWPNGRVLGNYTDHVPTKADAENFTHAYLGYYQVTNQNLVIEFFIPNTARFRWDYCREYYQIEGNRLRRLRQEMDGQTLRRTVIYERLPLGILERPADW